MDARKNGGDQGGCACGCGIEGAGDVGAGPGGHAVGVDPALKEQNLRHLRRIEGQVRGVLKMVEEDRYCAGPQRAPGWSRGRLRALRRWVVPGALQVSSYEEGLGKSLRLHPVDGVTLFSAPEGV